MQALRLKQKQLNFGSLFLNLTPPFKPRIFIRLYFDRLFPIFVLIFLGSSCIFSALSYGKPSTFPVPLEAAERPPVILSLGEQRLIHVNGLKRYSLGAKILKILPSPAGQRDALLLKAVQAGITDLWVWKQDGSYEHRSIEVRAWKKGPVTDLEKRLSNLREVEVWITGSSEPGRATYLVHGDVHDPLEAKRLGEILEAYPTQIQGRFQLSESLYREGEKKLRSWLETSRWKADLEVLADPSTRSLFVRGGLPDPKTRLQVEKTLRRAFPLAIIEIDSIPDRDPTIHFKVFLLELRKNRTRTLGVDLPGLIPNALKVSSLGIHTALSIEGAINALETDGSAKILSKPELVVRAPGEAELFAGGEIPISSKTVYSSKVEWRSYGLSLKLKVQAASGRRVRVDVQTEVSHLDPGVSRDNIPGLQSNRMKTQVDATFGQPLLLSGLLQEGVKKAVRGLPYLKSLPVLGLLFGSQDYIEDRSELVAILLPSRNIPEAPRIAAEIERPEGKVPLPRNWMSPEEEIALRSDASFPMNAFESAEQTSGDTETAEFSPAGFQP